jgi:hypothetical protein
MFVSYLWQVHGFLRIHRFPPPIKINRHDIADILLRVVLNTIKHKTNLYIFMMFYYKKYVWIWIEQK